MRKNIPKLIESTREIEVIGVAEDGSDGVRKAEELKPDVITLDVEMPKMNGLAALKYIMKNCPTACIMLSAYTHAQAQETIQALEYGAIDYVHKPSGSISLDIEKVSDELIRKIKAATGVNMRKLRAHVKAKIIKYRFPPAAAGLPAAKVVAIGTSTGGVRALEEIIPQLSKEMPAGVLIAQHMPKTFTSVLATYLNSKSGIKVKEAERGELIRPGVALLAPGGYHLSVTRRQQTQEATCLLSQEPKDALYIPCIDILMESVAKAYAHNAVGILLTGMGDDGATGLGKIKQKGGRTIAESESSAIIYGMPRAAAESGVADRVLPLTNIPRAIMGML